MADDNRAANESLLRAYQVVFGSPDGQIVLADLVGFCCAAQSCFHADQREHARNEGRREVFLRIHHFSKLHPDLVLQLAARRVQAIAPRGDTE